MVQLVLYNLLLPFGLLFSLPRLYLKMKKRGGYGPHFLQRMGVYRGNARQELEDERRTWWIHAVSVGEVIIASKLIEEIRSRRTELKLVLTTTTSTGFATAQERVPAGVTVLYNPFDLPGILHLALRFIRPEQILLIESELWPNLLTLAHRRAIPVSVVNARLSPRSERRYQLARYWVLPFLQKLSFVFAQATEDVPRWVAIGVPAAKVICVGSVKFDPGPPNDRSHLQSAQFAAWLHQLWPAEILRRILFLASSHAGEERETGKVFKSLRKRFPQLRLVVVPRHFERAQEVIDDLHDCDLRVQRRSALSTGSLAEKDPDVFLIDSTGELQVWYQFADVVIIGKSFIGRGGQNPVEPLLAGKPIVCGPHMENFSPLAERLVASGGMWQVRDWLELEEAVGALLSNGEKVRGMVEIAQAHLREHEGATTRTVDKLFEHA